MKQERIEVEMDKARKAFKEKVVQSIVALLIVLGISGTFFCSTVLAETPGKTEIVEPAMTAEEAGVMKFGLIAASVAFGLGAIGAGFAISHVGAAAMGAIAEKPEMAGQALIFVALAEGLVVFGFITALMILGKI
jgi:V/A-type H+-transporting ATPase subunit K